MRSTALAESSDSAAARMASGVARMKRSIHCSSGTRGSENGGMRDGTTPTLATRSMSHFR